VAPWKSAFPPRCPGEPFIAFTALALAHDRQRILAAGFFDHIIKPADPDEVVQAIVRATTSTKRTGVKEP
jgi:CheY-like chemotaxis protein